MDGFLVWARKQRDHWRELLPMLENGTIGTHEMRNGVHTDTTQETIEETMVRLADLEALIAKHEARDA